ncbi:O-methyltransferase MdmC-like [Physella acuta]|uniref:O-methyltransferase MdmC-like n=1 Tax=Physella acuta TaxID=109671 RepID=UPI0027DAC697|nr:O-methyltransferase MdmC-like [Physella acuta]XP_059157365.1 O-methyltransferase MdmC-like [Physella acuta]
MSQPVKRHYDPAVKEFITALRLAEETGAAPELVQALKYGLELVDLRWQFTLFGTSNESQACRNILEETHKHDWKTLHEQGKTTWELRPGMMSGTLEGQFLKSIVSIQRAKRVLDIGMFTGYSALSMAEALPDDGELVTIDQDEYLKTYVGETLLANSPHQNKIKILIGKAPEILKKMAEQKESFDIMFLDADKSEYLEYFKFAFEQNLLAPNGTVLVDNAYRGGDGYIPSAGETVTKTFVKAVHDNSSLHKVLVPIRDGVLMIRRLADVERAAV